MTRHYNAVVLLSGGMDSTTVLAKALCGWDPTNVLTLSFNYGQRHREQELAAAEDVALFYGVDHNIVDLTSLTKLLGGSSLTDITIPVPEGHYAAETMRITVVPNRNAIMLAIAFGAARAAGAMEVYIGAHAGDHTIYPDCREPFMHAFQRTMNLANDDLLPGQCPTLVMPFISKTKMQIVREGVKLDVPYQLTYSCYKGEEKHCGACGTCVERREAFILANIGDPTVYATNAATART